MTTRMRSMQTPTGAFSVWERDGAIVRASWGGRGRDTSDVLAAAELQLREYFSGTRTAFDLPMAPEVSDIARQFLDLLIAIPFGQTTSYGDLARVLKISAQATGQLCGANPIAIFIPCHRVLGAQSLGGFSGGRGIDTKVALLRHEGAAGLLI